MKSSIVIGMALGGVIGAAAALACAPMMEPQLSRAVKCGKRAVRKQLRSWGR